MARKTINWADRWQQKTGDGARESTHITVDEQENRVARLLQSRGGSHARPGSGAHPLGKGDTVTWKDLGECKQTAKKSISVKQKWLAKIEREAEAEGRLPFLHFEFLNEDRFTRGMTSSWVVLPEWFFVDLMEQQESAK